MSQDKKGQMFAKLAAMQSPAAPPPEPAPAPAPEEPPPSPAPPQAAPSTPTREPKRPKKQEPVKGKRGNPEYCQANAYVPRSLRKAVDRALLDTDSLDYSSLVTDLLRKWLKSRGVSE